MKENDKYNGSNETPKVLIKRLLNLLDSGENDVSEDELPENAVRRIVTYRERDKVAPLQWENFFDQQYKFPYEHYRIIGYEVNSGADRQWAKCLKLIRANIERTEFERLFAHTRIADFNNNNLTVSVPGQWYYDQIEKRYMPIIAHVLKQVFGYNVRLSYCFDNINNSTKFAIEAIDKVIFTCGMINIDVADITSTLSTDTLNYVTVSIGGSILNAMEQSVDNLPVTLDQVEKMLFQIMIPGGSKPDMSELDSMMHYIQNISNNIDVCWGVAFDESLADNIKVILISSSKL